MKQLPLALVVLACMAPIAFGAQPQSAPDWTLTDATGTEFTFSERESEAHQVVLFWATWCPYCKALLPHLQSIVHEYGGQVAVSAISIRDDGDPAKVIANSGFQFTVYANGDEVAERYGVKGTPGLFIVDPDGLIVFDLSQVLARPLEKAGEKLSNSQKAGRRAPFWAAQIRQALDASISQER